MSSRFCFSRECPLCGLNHLKLFSSDEFAPLMRSCLVSLFCIMITCSQFPNAMAQSFENLNFLG